jgi:hypothetical protein
MSERDNTDQPPLVYASWFRSISGPYELALDLGYRVSDDLPPKPDVRLIVAWEYAVALRDALSQLIETYEKASGEEIRKLGGVEVGPAQFVPEK